MCLPGPSAVLPVFPTLEKCPATGKDLLPGFFIRCALLCSQGSCSKSFWDLPLVEGPGRHVHPKTTTFCLVLGFTPSGRPSRAHQSQNDLEQDPPAVGAEPSGTFVVLFLFCLPLSQSLVAHSSGLFGTSRPVFPLSVFLTCNVGMKIAILRWFCSGRVTSGNPRPSFRVFWGASQSLFAASGFPDVSHQDEKRPLMHF